MYSRVYSFIAEFDILSQNQYGFREKHSSGITLLNLVDQVSNELDRKQFSICVFINLSKAFDTLARQILLGKLNQYGTRGMANSWFSNYLENGKQFVSIGTDFSDTCVIKCGVSQEYILGPLLFLLYINGIVNISDLATLILFAGDTNMFLCGYDLSMLISTVNTFLDKISQWFKANKLVIKCENQTLCYFIVNINHLRKLSK